MIGKAPERMRLAASLREAERGLWKNRRELVKFERTQKDFPFSRYFIGGEKPETPAFSPNLKAWRDDRLTLCWIGHATVLINFFGTWILTDPVWSDRVGYNILGLMTVGPRRVVEAPIALSALPPIDLILLSHCHMDHSDMPTLRKLRTARHTLVPCNTRDVFSGVRFPDCREIDWGDRFTYKTSGVTVEAIEVHHFGWRYPWDPCRGRGEDCGRSFNAYLVEKTDNEGKIRSFVFGGDTAFTPSFKTLGDRMRSQDRTIDVALMPIGAYNPWIGAHCSPDQAWQMTRDMNAEKICPIHWNTYIQSSEPRYEPIEWLESEIADPSRIVLRNIGETWSTK